MPRWLSAWIALYLGIFTAVALYFGVVYAVAHGEPSFTKDQRYQLADEYPGGVFVDDGHYTWCAGQEWWGIDVRGDQYRIGGGCIRWKPPVP